MNSTPTRVGFITDVAGIEVGHFTDARRPTGCTVILTRDGAVAGVDVRCAAPGARETDLLHPSSLVDRVHAITLAGSSAWGLDAASRNAPTEGNVGERAGALVGKLFGLQRAMRGGIGGASVTVDGITVGAIIACNALGDVIDPATGQPPVHTMSDGDTLFALSTGHAGRSADMLLLSTLAAEVTARPVVRAVLAAKGLTAGGGMNWPAACEPGRPAAS